MISKQQADKEVQRRLAAGGLIDDDDTRECYECGKLDHDLNDRDRCEECAAEILDQEHVEAMQDCINKAATFYADVMRQISSIVIQDYQNLNELGISLNKLKSTD